MGVASVMVTDNLERDALPKTLGTILRQERLRQKKSLDLVSEQLKIRKVFLEAIEQERFESLPGGVYTVGFIRSYAAFLGLDQVAIIDRLKDENFFSPVNLPSVGDEQHFIANRFVPSSMVLIGIFILTVCCIAAYFFLDGEQVHINWPNTSSNASL